MPADFSRLLVTCPHCQVTITFNDFIKDIEKKLSSIPVGRGSTKIRMLTVMERATIIQTIKGYSVKEIGKQLNRSSHTIEVHKYNAYKKLDVCNMLELMFALIALVADFAKLNTPVGGLNVHRP